MVVVVASVSFAESPVIVVVAVSMFLAARAGISQSSNQPESSCLLINIIDVLFLWVGVIEMLNSLLLS